MRDDRHGQSPKEYALANLKPVLARFPILTIKYPRSIFLTPKRETSGLQVFQLASSVGRIRRPF